MTLAAHVLLDTGGIVFDRSTTPPHRAVLVAVGDSRDLPPRLFAAADVDGPRVSVPGWPGAGDAAAQAAAIERLRQALLTPCAADAACPVFDVPPEGTAAAPRSPSVPVNLVVCCTAKRAAAGREDPKP